MSPRAVNRGFQTVVRDCRLSRGKFEARKRLQGGKTEVKLGCRNLLSGPNLEPPFGNHRLQTLGVRGDPSRF